MNNEIYEEHISRGIALMTSQQYEAAKKEFENAIEVNAKGLDAYIHLGNACANLEKYEEALKAFKNALIVDPGSASTYYSIGNIYLLLDDYVKAVEFYNKAEAAGFKTGELYNALAYIFFTTNDIPQALRNITKAIEADPLNGDYRIFKVRIYLALDRYNEALDTLDDMHKLLPDSFEVYDLRAQIHLGLGNAEEALKIVDEGCARFPKDPLLALSKLKALVGLEKVDEAESFIAFMKENDLYDAVFKDASIHESTILIYKNKVSEGIEVLSKANTKLGNDADILFLLTDLYFRTENYEKCAESAAALADLNPIDLYFATAKMYQLQSLEKLGKLPDPKVEYRKLANLFRRKTIENPHFYEGYLFRIICHTELGEYDEALELADYVEALYPDRADANTFRYNIYTKKGDKENAEIAKAAALKLDPDLQL